MLIDIDRLPKEGLRLSRDFEFLSLDLVEESAVFLEPAHAEVTSALSGTRSSSRARSRRG